GCCIYNGGAWPAQFEGSGFLSEPTVNVVHNDWLQPSGATFVAGKESGREMTEFITSSDLMFRPIHTRVGPDGALYLVDFYNQAVVHNDPRGPPHGARNAATRPDRNHDFGRIWRIQHKQAKSLPPWTLDSGNPENLVAMLAHPNGWVRGTAQRLLQEQSRPPESVISSLGKMLDDPAAKSLGRIHCLWTLANLGALPLSSLMATLSNADPIMLKNAIRIAALQKVRDSGHSPTQDGVGARLEGASFERLILANCSHTDLRVR